MEMPQKGKAESGGLDLGRSGEETLKRSQPAENRFVLSRRRSISRLLPRRNPSHICGNS
jgi:hypothetical protein